jgi:hypothetical protein
VKIAQCVASAALCAAVVAASAQVPAPQEPQSGRPIDWRPQWIQTPSAQPGYADPYMGWGVQRRTGPGPRHPDAQSPAVQDIHPPSPLGDRDRYTLGVGIVPVYEVLIIPGTSPCPPPYSSAGCMPMR